MPGTKSSGAWHQKCKCLVNQLWDHRMGKNKFAGIVLQEYCPKEKRMIGPITNIFKGTDLGLVEAPHIYRRNDFYYLMTAEGGTTFKHAVTFARSRSLEGPYELHPENPILTSWTGPELELQRAGHGSLVETQDGQWYMAYLCGRPLPNRGRCIMGRETALQKMIWSEDDWLYVEGGGNHPQVNVSAPDLEEIKWEEEPVRDDFDSKVLNIHFQTLRMPLGDEFHSLTERPGYLRLKGSGSLGSRFHQSFIARRQQAFCYTAASVVEFEPDTFQQMAGLSSFHIPRMVRTGLR